LRQLKSNAEVATGAGEPDSDVCGRNPEACAAARFCAEASSRVVFWSLEIWDAALSDPAFWDIACEPGPAFLDESVGAGGGLVVIAPPFDIQNERTTS
jgi:hypothetical protein